MCFKQFPFRVYDLVQPGTGQSQRLCLKIDSANGAFRSVTVASGACGAAGNLVDVDVDGWLEVKSISSLLRVGVG